MAPYSTLDGAPPSRPNTMRYGLLHIFSGRRGRTLILLGVAVTLLLCWSWTSPENPYSYQNLKNHKMPTFSMPKWRLGDTKPIHPEHKLSGLEGHANVTDELDREGSDDDIPALLGVTKKGGPSFHLVVLTSSSNEDYCKTILSAMLGNYPPPTIIHAGQEMLDDDHPGASPDLEKIKGVKDFLNDERRVQAHDLVIVIDGFGVWFQLPSDVMINQYQTLVAAANAQLELQYGTVSPAEEDPLSDDNQPKPRFNLTVVWGADKLCRPNADTSAACTSVPNSTLPEDVYGDATDRDAEGYRNRPKYIESGTVIGPAGSLRKIFEAAYDKALDTDRSAQYIFAEMYGEQERARARAGKQKRPEGKGIGSWFAKKLGVRRVVTAHNNDGKSGKGGKSGGSGSGSGDGSDTGEKKANVTTKPTPQSSSTTTSTTTSTKPETDMDGDSHLRPSRNYEFGMGLDYAGLLWQTTNRLAANETEFLVFKNTNKLARISRHRPKRPALELPKPLAKSEPPFATRGSDRAQHDDDDQATSSGPQSDRLDAHIPPADTPWANVPLAANTYTGRVPAALHLSEHEAASDHTSSFDDSSTGDHAVGPGGEDWWPRLWFQPHARALLRRYMRAPQAPLVAAAGDAASADQGWDLRGGRGGMWNKDSEWSDWGEVCVGTEEAVFRDGKGDWGLSN